MNVDGLITNVNIASFQGINTQDPYGIVEQGCVVWQGGKILFAGAQADCPEVTAQTTWDGKGGWLTPGLIDCHTHLVYGGNRADEFEQLREGVRYEEIAKNGGGINRTVRDTRAATESELKEQAKQRLQRLMAEGVTTVEIKSGYGLSLEGELKILGVIQQLGSECSVDVVATCLAAHTVPFDFTGDADAYLAHVIDVILPAVVSENLAQAVDVFCESIAFNAEQTERLFTAATGLGLSVKGHVEQLSQQNGANVVAKHKGLSADHIEYLTEAQAVLLGHHNVAAVLLPGAFYYLSETQKPPVNALRKHNVAMAVATDLNPGTSPLNSLLMAANMACVLFGLTPAEAWAGITKHAAQALGLAESKGRIAKGFDVDLVLWDCDHPRQIIHELNRFTPKNIWYQGQERAVNE